MNPGGGGFSEPRLGHCTPAWAIRVKLYLRKKKKRKDSLALLAKQIILTKHPNEKEKRIRSTDTKAKKSF